MTRDLTISLGWLVVFLFSYNIAFAFLKRGLHHLKQGAPVNYNGMMTVHKIVGLLTLILVILHISRNIPYFSLKFGWILFSVFLVMVSSGMLGAMFHMGKKLRAVHTASQLLFITLVVIHITMKVFLHM